MPALTPDGRGGVGGKNTIGDAASSQAPECDFERPAGIVRHAVTMGGYIAPTAPPSFHLGDPTSGTDCQLRSSGRELPSRIGYVSRTSLSSGLCVHTVRLPTCPPSSRHSIPISFPSVLTKLTRILSTRMPAQQDHDVLYNQISPNKCVLPIACD